MTAYYNEWDPFAAAWLRELIKEGLIANGEVDTRSVADITGSDLRGFTQVHLFAGIGGWSYALRLADWPDDRPVWTGSCPCQPFSQAGLRKGTADARHLWPQFNRLISECSPATIFGEQVASKDGRLWLARVRADLETLGYGVGAADLCAAGVSAPHIRQRLFWVANTTSTEFRSITPAWHECADGKNIGDSARVAIAARKQERTIRQSRIQPISSSSIRLGNANSYHKHWWSGPVQMGRNGIEGEVERSGRKYLAQWRVGPGIPIVANGIPNRVGTLRGAGNAIVPQVAAEFIKAAL